MKKLLYSIALLLCSMSVALAQPSITGHQIMPVETNPVTQQPRYQALTQYNKLEVGIGIGNIPTGTNVYDPDQIDIQVVFTPTSLIQQYFVTAFYYEEFQYRDCNNTPCNWAENNTMAQNEFVDPASNLGYNFRARFSPPLIGTYDYVIHLKYNGTIIQSTSPQTFTITQNQNSNRGFLSVNTNPSVGLQYGSYVFDNGEGYFPTGVNLHWYDKPYSAHFWRICYEDHLQNEDHFQTLVERGGNFARLLMGGDSWGMRKDDPTDQVIWDPTTGQPLINGFNFNMQWGFNKILGDYSDDESLRKAWLLDQLIKNGEDNGIYFQLALTLYSEFVDRDINDPNWPPFDPNDPNSLNDYDWDFNPLRQISGLTGAAAYTNQTAKDMHKRKLRYILSRWGYSTNIFAWEVLTEAELSTQSGASDADIISWITDMCGYVNSTDALDGNEHMITVSTGAEYDDSSPGDIVYELNTLSEVDFMSHHTYISSELYNFAHFRKKKGIDKVNKYNKPFTAGEFGIHPTQGELATLEHDREDDNSNIHFHNTIWSSSFSGQSSTSTHWYTYIFNNGTTNINHFTPLRTLVDQFESDLQNHRYDAIASQSAMPSINDLAMTYSELNYFRSVYKFGFDKAFPVPNTDISFGVAPTVTFPTTGTLESIVKIFALRSDDTKNTYGWIHKNDNFWWKVPHLGDKNNSLHNTPVGPDGIAYDGNCAYYSGQGSNTWPQTAADCNNFPLENVDAVFTNMCNGEYYIDYYSTYPNHPTDDAPNAPADVDGGIIPSLTRRIFTGNDLMVNLPKLSPLSQDISIDAPDYGFHLRRVALENYTYINIGNYTAAEQAATLYNTETFYHTGQYNSAIFFKGQGNYMHHYQYDPNILQWTFGSVNGGTIAPNEDIKGDIATDNYNEDKVFYIGSDDRIHMYGKNLFGPPNWLHDCVGGCSTPSTEFANHLTDIVAMDDKVFYKGLNDELVHMYYLDNGIWTHTILNPTATSNSEKVGSGHAFAIANEPHSDPDKIFFINFNGDLAMYERNGSNSSAWSHSVIGPATGYNNYISAGYVGDDIYVFYRGYTVTGGGAITNSLEYYKKEPGSSWVHGTMADNPSFYVQNESYIFFDDNVVYYNGVNGRINRFYWDITPNTDKSDGKWRHSYINVCDPYYNSANAFNFRFTSDNNIIYVDSDLWTKMLWNQRTCNNCTYGDIPNYRIVGEEDNIAKQQEATFQNYMNEINNQNNQQTADVQQLSDNENNKFHIMVYPNPAKDVLKIGINASKQIEGQIRISGMDGRLIKQQAINIRSGISETEIDISGLSTGVYIYDINTPEIKTRGKFTKL